MQRLHLGIVFLFSNEKWLCIYILFELSLCMMMRKRLGHQHPTMHQTSLLVWILFFLPYQGAPLLLKSKLRSHLDFFSLCCHVMDTNRGSGLESFDKERLF